MVAAMDRAADPCDDFYRYACGGWLDATTLPPERARMGRSWTTIYDRNQEVLRELLEAASSASVDPSRARVGTLYGACIDEATIDARGIEPVRPWLDRVDAVTDLPGVWRLAGELHAEAFEPFFGAAVWADAKDPDTDVLQLVQGGVSLPDRSYYLDDTVEGVALLEAFEAHIAKMFVLAGDTEDDAAERAEAVAAFESALAEMAWPRQALRDSDATSNPSTEAELVAMAPELPWAELFSGGDFPSEPMNIMTPSTFESMDDVVADADLQTLRSYLRWVVLHGTAQHLSAPFREEDFDFFNRRLSGQEEPEERWKRCVALADRELGDLSAQAYVDQVFAGSSKSDALAMIAGIEMAFEEALPRLAWMDDETRAVAVTKARSVKNKIGYPDEFREYPGLTLGEGHFENVMAVRAHNARWWLDKIGEPVDADAWFMSAPTVNAYYNPSENEIVFPAGILQPPFFSASFPKAVNYGAIGAVMGHELSHGFDDEGRKFAPSGELMDWWPEDVVASFEERASCVVDQYAGYELQPGVFVNGELTLGENIADGGGIKQSFLAYRAWAAEHGAEPGLGELNAEQLFFVSFGQGWCSMMSPELERMYIQADTHSPPRFRVNGSLRNFDLFAETFECAEGSAMNPVDRCEVW